MSASQYRISFPPALCPSLIVEVFCRVTDSPCLSSPSSRLGIEGLITFKKDQHTFDPENYCITLPSPTEGGQDVTLAVFDKVTVNIAVEKDRNTQRGKVKMTLVEPIDSSGL